ncbi:MATE family efflux transporter [Actinoplanes sp. TRM 88003]|uniref:Probable multidrug resistance protein NorM n=1 Tax=Paractinoplanes aksuensis TaxID=2939490 RepID=A0ABT1E193_9ACTN|nr:MATE family efflux transporter [Actinoplanes aksuensis]MCO8276887.1 MATE family efflux transporter [Actinoplanes aksuensis]
MRSLPYPAVVRTAFPLYVTTLVASAGALVNTATLGRHATSALAAFAVAMAVYVPVVATVTGVMRGMMPYVSRHDNDHRRLGSLLGNGLWLSYTIGGLGALAVLGTPHLAEAIDVTAPTIRGLGALPILLALAVVAQSVGASAGSTLVTLGRGRTVMRSGLISTAATVGLSLLLVPALGVVGAGTAMVVAAIAYAGQVQLALRKFTGLRRTIRPGRPDHTEITLIARTGLPMAGTVLVKFAVLGVLTFAAARLGTGPAAVHGVAESLVNIIYAVAVSVGQAVVPMIGRSLRDGDAAGARRGAGAGAVVALLWVGLLSGLTIVAGGWIVPLFSSDAALQHDIRAMLPLVAFAVLTDAAQAVYGFGLLGLSRTMPGFVSTAVFFGLLCLLAVPVADAGGLTALWAALGLANLAQAISKAYFFHRATRPSLARKTP